MSEKLQTLFSWLRAGCALLPIAPDSKRPLLVGGYRSASSDEAKVVEWHRRWPRANWAIACEQSGVFVVDCDECEEPNGLRGFDQFCILASSYSSIPRTYMQVTPSGGVHFFFRCDYGENPLPSTVKRIASRVDTRGVGGYVMIPPSVVNGEGYAPFDDDWPAALAEMPHAPQWLVALVMSPLSDEHSALRMRRALARDDQERAQGALARIVAWLAGVKEGERNNALYWAACELRDLGFERDVAQRALLHACALNGLPEREAERTIASAYKSR
ncbi:MAG: bifunctional DNA primase/polymerase [Thermoflexales bacterium]